MPEYKFLPNIVLRTPVHSFCPIISEEDVRKLVKDPFLLESIYLASPSLFQAILELEKNKLAAKDQEKVIISVAKYILRSHSRPTPFGLFAGNSVTTWGNTTQINLKKEIRRKTELNFSVFSKIYQSIKEEPEGRSRAKYYPNSSYYILNDEIRYVEEVYDGDIQDFQISAIDNNEYILAALELAENGATLLEISKLFISEEITPEEAIDFANSLADCHILVSELEPDLCSANKITDLINTLKSKDFPLEQIKKTESIKTKLDSLDSRLFNEAVHYKNIEQLLDGTEQRAFHVDSYFDLEDGHSLNQELQSQLLDASYIINTLKLEAKDTDLLAFKERFKRRYGHEKIALLVALDTERGVGYADKFDTCFAPLISQIDFEEVQSEPTTEVKNHNEIFLENILKEAAIKDIFEIKLENEDLTKIDKDINLSTTSPVIFKLLAENKLFLEGLGGSSALNLICRFGNSSNEIGKIIDHISTKEITTNPTITYAEVHHIPNVSLGNVLCRKRAFENEIGFLSNTSSLSSSIKLRDINVFLENETLYLEHSKSGRIIIPRLSNTFNVNHESLPIYKFLFDFQFQDMDKSLKFDWPQSTASAPFLPRISYNGVILSLASWNLSENALKTLKTCSDFYGWKKEHRLPDLFVISEGDNDLFINTESPFLINVFIETVKNKSSVIIKEFLFDENIPVKSFEKKAKVNQFVASIFKDEPSYSSPKETHYIKEDEHQFLPKLLLPASSNWLYLKLYCSPGTADNIFSNHLSTFIMEAQLQKLLDKWFFIRYRDPDFHLRIRFHLNGTQASQKEFFSSLRQCLNDLKQMGLVWKWDTDEYQPETDRYGAIGIDAAEAFFFNNSMAYLHFINATDIENKENERWLFALRTVDNTLDSLHLSLPEKKEIISIFRDRFFKEFGIDQVKKKKIDNLYRENRSDINYYLRQKSEVTENILKSQKNELPNISLSSESDRDAIFGLTHMVVNRIILIQPRLHEFLIYDFLYREYQSQMARTK